MTANCRAWARWSIKGIAAEVLQEHNDSTIAWEATARSCSEYRAIVSSSCLAVRTLSCATGSNSGAPTGNLLVRNGLCPVVSARRGLDHDEVGGMRHTVSKTPPLI